MPALGLDPRVATGFRTRSCARKICRTKERRAMSKLQTISPERAAELVRAGAVLIDIREADEHARERIPGARHHALTRIDRESPARGGDDVLIFHCRSGARTQ